MKIILYMNHRDDAILQWIIDNNIRHTVLEINVHYRTFELVPTVIEIPDDSVDLDLYLLRWSQ